MTVQLAAITFTTGLLSFTNITTTMYDYFETYQFGDPRIEVMILAPYKSIEIERYLFMESVDTSVFAQNNCTYTNSGIDVNFATSAIKRLALTRTAALTGQTYASDYLLMHTYTTRVKRMQLLCKCSPWGVCGPLRRLSSLEPIENKAWGARLGA
jgi:hypothetical protein